MRSSQRWSAATNLEAPATAPRPAGVLASTPRLPPRPGGAKPAPRPAGRTELLRPPPPATVSPNRDTMIDEGDAALPPTVTAPKPVAPPETVAARMPSMEIDLSEEEALDSEDEVKPSVAALAAIPESRPVPTMRSTPPPVPSRRTRVPSTAVPSTAIAPPPSWVVEAVAGPKPVPKTIIEPIVPAEMRPTVPVRPRAAAPVAVPVPAPVLAPVAPVVAAPVAPPVVAAAPPPAFAPSFITTPVPVTTRAPLSAVAPIPPTQKSHPIPAPAPIPEVARSAPRLITPAPSQPMRATLSSVDDILVHLFEAMFDLHYLADSVQGANFCLSVALGKLPSRAGFVHLYDIDLRAFVTVAIHGDNTGSMLAARHSDADPMLMAAMREQRAVVFNRGHAPALPRHASLGPVESVIVAPVLDGGRFLGAIELYNPLDGAPFREREQNALTYIGERFAEFVATRGVVVDAKTIGVLSAAAGL